jgi:hypothetical protein
VGLISAVTGLARADLTVAAAARRGGTGDERERGENQRGDCD